MRSNSKYKIVLIGDLSVGKTSLIHRFIHQKIQSLESTIAIDFITKNILFRKQYISINLWDTAGQQRYRSLIPSYLKNTRCAILVYDLDMQTFNNLSQWIELYNQNKCQDSFLVICGNKIDLRKQRVDNSVGRRYANELGIPYFEVSAKTGGYVQKMFESILELIHGCKDDERKQIQEIQKSNDKLQTKQIGQKSSIQLNGLYNNSKKVDSKKQKSSCCKK